MLWDCRRGIKFHTLGAQTCTFTTHAKKVGVFTHLYVSTGKNNTFTHHHAPVDVLGEGQLEVLLQERHDKETWVLLLHGANQQALSKSNEEEVRESVLDAVTPGCKRKNCYEEVKVSSMNLMLTLAVEKPHEVLFDDEIKILPLEDSSDLPHEDRVGNKIAQWDQVIATVNKIGLGLGCLQFNVLGCVMSLEGRLLRTDVRMGVPPSTQSFEDCGSVWDGLELLNSNTRDVMAALEAHTTQVGETANKIEERLKRALQEERRTLEMSTRSGLGCTQQAMSDLAEFIKLLAVEQEKLTETVVMRGETNSLASLVEINGLKTKLRLLEAKLPHGVAGQLGGEVFQFRVDVLLFIENYVPSKSFYLFHDVITLMESLTMSHVLQEWYQSAKVGVNESSARCMASFRLVLPTVFGRTKEGAPPVSVKHLLPAVKSFKDWNNHDGVSGVKGCIMSAMEGLKYQFRKDINQHFDSESQSKAGLMAPEMHNLSQNFVMEMSSWMDSFYQELVTTLEATEEEAWDVVSACIRKMFEVIRVPSMSS